MMQRRDRGRWIGTVLKWIVIWLLIAVLVYVFRGAFIAIKIATENNQKCLEAGYSEMKSAGGQWYCIGIRDGSSVAVPVGEVGR